MKKYTWKYILTLLGQMAILMLLWGLPVMLLWNWLIPSILGLGKISFSQAVGLYLLVNFITGKISIIPKIEMNTKSTDK